MTHQPVRLAIRTWLKTAIRQHAHRTAAALFAAALTPHHALADTTWTNGNGTNFWSQSGNWSPASEPNFFTGTTIFPSPIPAPHGTITLGPLEGTSDIRFETGGYTLTGGDLNISTGNVTVVTGNSSIFTPFTSDGLNGLTKLGAGVLNLQGHNTYNGPTNVIEGLLDISGTSEIIPDNSAVTLSPGTEMRFFLGSLNETIGSLAGSGTVVFANSSDETFLTVGQKNIDTTFSGNIIESFGGSGGLTKTGTAVLTLSGDNNYSFATTISQGTLRIDPGGSSLPDSGQINLSGIGTTLDINNDTETIGSLIGNGNVTLTGISAVLQTSNATDSSFSGDLSGAGNFQKAGPATMTYTGAATNTGDFEVHDGTMTISSPGSFNGMDAVRLMSDGILNLNSTGTSTTLNLFVTDTATYNQTNATLNITNSLNLNNNANMNLASGSVSASLFSFFSNSTYTQTDGSMTVANSISLNSSSDFNLNGGTVEADSLNIANTSVYTQTDGTATITGLTKAINTSTLNLSGGTLTTGSFTQASTATFNHTGGTLAVGNGSLTLPSVPYIIDGADNPNIQLDGPATSWNHSEPVTVADDLQGQLTISNSATANLTSPSGLIVGAAPPSTGLVLVESATLDLTNNPLVVGVQGSGSVGLSANAMVMTGQTTIGKLPGSEGLIALVADNASWTDSVGPLVVGDQGNGELQLFGSNAEVVSTNGATIGLAPGGTGTVTISGDANHWNVSSFLTVGESGSAQILLNDYGRVDVAGPTIVAKLPGSVGRIEVLTRDFFGLGPSTLFTESLDIGGHTSTGAGGNGTMIIQQLSNATVTTGATTLWPNAQVINDGGSFTTPALHLHPASRFQLQNNGTLNIPNTTGVTGPHSAFIWDTGTINIATDASLGNPILPNATTLQAGQTLDVTGTITVGPSQVLAAVGTAQIFANVLSVNGGTVAAPTVTIGTEHIHALVGHGSVLANIATGTTDSNTDIVLTGNLAVGNPTSTSGFDFAGNLYVNAHRLIINDADQALIHGPTSLDSGGSINAVNGAILTGDGTLNATGPTSIEGNFTNNGALNGPSTPGEFLTFHDNVDGLGTYGGNLLFEKGFTPPPMMLLTGDVELGSAADLSVDLTNQLNIAGNLHADGTLTVGLPDGYHPTINDTFTLLTFATITGDFTAINLPTLGHGLSLDTTGLSTTGTLTVIPEPATLALLLTAWLPFSRRRRPQRAPHVSKGSLDVFIPTAPHNTPRVPLTSPLVSAPHTHPIRVPLAARLPVLLPLTLLLLITPPTFADAKYSIIGSFASTADTQDITFDLFDTVTNTDPFTIETHHWAGGTNHAGDTILSGSFDSTLTLFDSTPTQVAFDSEISVGPADFDARISYVPDANITPAILASDTYNLRLGVFSGQPLLAGYFAVDLLGPDNDMVLTLPSVIEHVPGTTGILNIALVGPGSSAVPGGTFLDIATSAGASGLLRILDGASVNAPGGTFIALGSPTSSGQLEVGGNNATLNTSTLSIGINGDADVTISTGGKINATGTTTVGPNGHLFQSDGTEFTTASLNFSVAGSSYNHYGGTLTINGGTLTPPAGDYTIANPGSPHVKLTNGATWDQTSGLLTIGKDELGSLTIESGATLNQGTQNASIGDSTASSVTVNVTGLGSTWTHGTLNTAINSHAQLNIKDQGRVNTTNANFSTLADGSTTVNVSDPGSLWNIAGQLTAPGHFSTANITVEKGGTIQVAGPTTLGAAFGSTGTLNVKQTQGGNDAAFTTNGLQIGGDSLLPVPDDVDSVGTLNIQTGGHVTVTDPGTKLWNQGTINLTGGKLTTAGLDLTTAGAAFNHTGGTADINANTFQPPTGPYTINGANNPQLKITQAGSWNETDTILVASTNQASLTVAAGGTAISNDVFVGHGDTAQGTATLSNPISQWTNTAMIVGYNGQGTLLINDAAMMNTTGNAIIGDNTSTATGHATVTDEDTNWQANELIVASAGHGTLDILAGGSVLATNTHVSALSTGDGNINVSGTGTTDPSTFTTTNLDVGGSGPSVGGTPGGHGTLNINTGALAQVTGTRTKLWPQGSIDINGGTFETQKLELTNGSRLRLYNGGTLTIPTTADTSGPSASFQWQDGTLNVNGGALGSTLLPAATSLNDGQTLNVTSTLTVGPAQLLAIAGSGSVTAEIITLNNGTIIAPTITIGTGHIESIYGTGSVAANIATGPLDGNLIRATGPLSLGNPASTDGYNYAGQLVIDNHRVILNDADHATLGSTTNILIDGSINAVNGALLPPTHTLITDPNISPTTNHATIEGNFTNNGTVNGPTFPNDYLLFEDDLNGTGNYTGNIRLNNDFNPGLSPAAVNFNGHLQLTEHATVHIEVQAPAPATSPLPGVDHDQINITGPVTLDGTLNLTLLDGVQPAYGTEYVVLTYGTRDPAGGAGPTMFDAITGTLIATDFALAPLFDDTSNTLTIRATIPGDLNLDNIVSVADLAVFALNFDTTPGLHNDTDNLSSWRYGDLNTDGQITVADLSLLALNFGFDATDPSSTPTPLSLETAATLAGIDPTTIPEPATALLALITPLTILARRTNKQNIMTLNSQANRPQRSLLSETNNNIY